MEGAAMSTCTEILNVTGILLEALQSELHQLTFTPLWCLGQRSRPPAGPLGAAGRAEEQLLL